MVVPKRPRFPHERDTTNHSNSLLQVSKIYFDVFYVEDEGNIYVKYRQFSIIYVCFHKRAMDHFLFLFFRAEIDISRKSIEISNGRERDIDLTLLFFCLGNFSGSWQKL